jgi:crotonobetainyl-CoA:carnitine CoA-transferase CaiB-like acyl-CoA transferase
MDGDRLPLSGIRAVELGHIVAGPSGGMLLADLGADVIKVEEPRAGDQSRSMPNRGSIFYAYNRNKRSLALDLKAERGREVFERVGSRRAGPVVRACGLVLV